MASEAGKASTPCASASSGSTPTARERGWFSCGARAHQGQGSCALACACEQSPRRATLEDRNRMRCSQTSSPFSLSPPEPPSPQGERQGLEPPPNHKNAISSHAREPESILSAEALRDARIRGHDKGKGLRRLSTSSASHRRWFPEHRRQSAPALPFPSSPRSRARRHCARASAPSPDRQPRICRSGGAR